MNKLALAIAAVAFMAAGASADWTKTYPTAAADSSAVAKKYWAQSYDEKKGTSTKLEVTAEGALKVTATWGNVPQWGAAAGILQPFTQSWDNIDFSNVTAVQFTYRTASGVPAEFTLSSDAYPLKDEGVMMTKELKAATAWTTVTVNVPKDLVYLSWMETNFPDGTGTTWDDVKSSIKIMQFSPKPTYNGSGTAVTKPTATMEIKSITVIGDVVMDADVRTPAAGTGCNGISYELAEPGSNKNPQGGWWYAFSDTTSGTPGSANGGTTFDEASGGALEYTETGLKITATLNKIAGGVYRPYSGWADLGTGFQTSGRDKERNLTGITAFSFEVQYNAGFDVEKVGGVDFKVSNASVGDSVTFVKRLPASQTGFVCVDLAELKQPSWYTKKYNVNTPFSAADVSKFAWEMKIQDQGDDAIFQSGPNSIEISNPRIWSGSTVVPTIEPSAIKTVASRAGALSASYNKGLILSYNLAGASSAKVEITRLDGTKVASLNAGASADKSMFNVNLTRGTYLVTVKGGATSMSRVLAVAK